MSKKILLISLVLVIIGALVVTGCSAPAGTQPTTTVTVTATAPAQTAAPIRIVFANWAPPVAATAVTDVQWGKELELASGGRIKVEYNQGSAMGAAPEHYNLAVTGVADAANAGLTYTPGAFPMAEIPELPSAPTSPIIFARANWELYKMGYFDKDFKDVKLLYLEYNGPYDIITTGKAIRTFDDLKGMKIRVSGAGHTEIIKAMGATPVSMPAPDQFDAMSKGVVDGTYCNWGAILAFGLVPVVKNFTQVGAGFGMHAAVMNKAFYEKLPADIKGLIDSMGEKYSVLGGLLLAKEDELVKYKMYKGDTHILSAADVAKLDNAMAPLWKKWIADGDAKGLPRAKMAADFYNILKHFGTEKPFYGYTP